MYVTNFHIYGSKQYPLVLGSLYEAIAEKFELPALETLVKSLNNDVEWNRTERNRLQVHYLEDMIEQQDKSVFQVRFATNKDVRDLTSLFLSVRASQVLNISISFPGRNGRGAFSKMLALLKSLSHRLRTNELDFEIEGFSESSPTYIRERSLSAFVWVDGVGRYLHTRENPNQIDEVKKGRRTL